MRTNSKSSDRGSIPIALLVIIMMGGLLAALTSRTIAEQRATGFDVEYTGAVHAAEMGLDDVLFRLNNSLIVTTQPHSGSGTGGNYDYEWDATYDSVRRAWTVTSTAEGANGTRRTVRARIQDEPIFDLSLATHLTITFGGGNTADSYRSHTAPQTRCSLVATPSCYGIIASNGNIEFGSQGNNNSYADRVRVHDWANNPGPHRCQNSTVYCEAPFRENFEEPLNLMSEAPLVQAMLDACAGNFPNWKASTAFPGNNNPASLTASAGHPAVATYNQQTYNVRCFGEVEIDKDVSVGSAFTRTNPFIMVIRDRLIVSHQTKVNCTHCGNNFPSHPNMPIARRLQIFTLAQDGNAPGNTYAAVQIRNQTHIGAAIYAPRATCGNLQTSVAGVQIYGSLVCRSVTNQGGWGFHYDEDLLNGLSTQQYDVTRWSEELPADA